jgi:mRNA-degrading endonuclease RelE of RelBE toxin-antitoxin system
MKYELVYTRRAVKDIQKMAAENRERIGKALLRYEQNSLLYAERHGFSTGNVPVPGW